MSTLSYHITSSSVIAANTKMFTEVSVLTTFNINLTLIRVFRKLDKIGYNANIGIRGFTTWKQKIPVTKFYTQWGLKPRPLINLSFQV